MSSQEITFLFLLFSNLLFVGAFLLEKRRADYLDRVLDDSIRELSQLADDNFKLRIKA